MAQTLIVIIFLGILISLGSAGVFLIRDKGRSTRTAKALSIRIGISIGLFLLLFLLQAAGLITPHGVMGSPDPEPAGNATRLRSIARRCRQSAAKGFGGSHPR